MLFGWFDLVGHSGRGVLAVELVLEMLELQDLLLLLLELLLLDLDEGEDINLVVLGRGEGALVLGGVVEVKAGLGVVA